MLTGTNEPDTLPAVKQSDLKEAMRIIGARGGKKRAKNLTKEQRSEIARNAATARWKNRKGGK